MLDAAGVTKDDKIVTYCTGGIRSAYAQLVLEMCGFENSENYKDDLQMISDWLESAEETAVLILVSDEISVDAKLTKIVPASNKKQFWEMFEDKKLPWIYNY